MRMVLLLLIATAAHAHSDRPNLKLRPPSYVEEHNHLVQRSFLRFAAVDSPERAPNRLETLRDRDRLLLFHQTNNLQTGYGAALFGAATVFSAHAPPRLRPIFDGPVHVGPALFDLGGMGAGIGGRFL
jgi:hypothetical protein